ncbi:hypothetical protein UP10_16790 [Bradyrhizobium sp. LTSPM299]|uniref:hypothetical protein n=1 Tax=Bradyrhizobium sp. LTSPM299 TaxID=1619233 RepID=UPI0005C92B70|nr:hypothetical protein [Bradyrhizobium sp. LTSPM299]KJC59796.1 hypothetical protein UP10_16790 [Bradyrhizobium sp. LTSPM299]
MSSRALSLATVMLLIGCLSAGSAHAQNLEAGKSPSQIFSNTCTACHKSPRGLLKTVPASSLPGFLRQHYTTSSDMAGVLSSYLISNGANDQRYQAKDPPKGTKGAGKDAGQDAKQSASPEQAERPGRRQHPAAAPQEAVKPDADGLTQQGEAHPGHKGKRLARPSEPVEGAKPADGQTPEAAGEGKPSRHKLGRRGKPVEEKPDDAAKDAAKGETPKDDSKAQTVKGEDKGEAEKPTGAKSSSDKSSSDKSDSAKVDAPKEAVGSEPAPLRSDPVPPVTPAPPAATAAPAASSSPAPAAAPQPAAAAPPVPAPAPPPVTAAAPPPSPAATPAGPPEPPISR